MTKIEVSEMTPQEMMHDAETRMDIEAAIACGELWGEPGTERTVYEKDGVEPVVSYWPVAGGGWEARWHRREERPGANGDLTYEGGDMPPPEAYYSREEFPPHPSDDR